MAATVGGLHAGALAAVAAIVLAAGFIQATAGFGFALLAVPLLALVLPPQTAVVVTFLHGTCSSLLTAGRHHRQVDRTETARLGLGAVLGLPLGALILTTASASVLRLLVGLATCAAALWMLRPRRQPPAPRTVAPLATVGVGMVSGVLNTAVATNGPPLVVYLRSRGLHGEPFRATLSAVFVISNVVGLVVLAVVGAVHGAAVAVFALTLVPATVGWFAGNHAAGRLRTAHFVRMVDLVLLASGLLAIGRALV